VFCGYIDEQAERLLLAGVQDVGEIAATIGVSRRRAGAARRRVLLKWRNALADKENILAQEVATLQFMRFMLWRLAFRTDSVSEQLQTFKLLLSVNERLLKLAQPHEEHKNGETQQLIQQIETLLQLLARNGQNQSTP